MSGEGFSKVVDEWWPVSDGRCPQCGRYTGDRIAHRHGDDSGSVTGTCKRHGNVELTVIGWSNGREFC